MSVALTFVQVGDPSQSNHISAAFSRVDFDSEEEYIRFYSSNAANYVVNWREISCAVFWPSCKFVMTVA